jgi:Ala-tRNA(Pro) deacylase
MLDPDQRTTDDILTDRGLPILDRIKSFLTREGIQFREIHHQETKTSAESAQARGEPLEIGGKALLMKVDDAFRLFVISAARKSSSKKIKTYFSAARLRFATPEELRELTGLAPGSVPPFGQPILDFPLYIDDSVAVNPRIAFNAGSLTDSIILNTSDYLRVCGGTRLEIAE